MSWLCATAASVFAGVCSIAQNNSDTRVLLSGLLNQ
jgi:hypothetical protein